ncbi:MAG: translation initiation factor IF-3 [Clostridia bacterium]|nr:translation initiation factor IF-3 [Clostridia bacterium]
MVVLNNTEVDEIASKHKSSKSSHMRINDEIKAKEVRLIGPNGDMMGIVTPEKALQVAMQNDLDLVEISPNANPPVCKVIDYGKYMFDMAKRQKEAHKHQKASAMKEVWLKPKIEDHDFNVKTKNANKFLSQGHKVRVSLRFRGREMAYTHMGRDLMLRFAEACSENGEMDNNPKLEGRNMLMTLSPATNKKK